MARKGKLKKRNNQEQIERPVRYKKYQQFFLIVCEDQNTEPTYFDQFVPLFPEYSLYLKPIGVGKDPLGVVEASIIERDKLQVESRKEIDFVWAVFDKDDADENPTKITRFERAFEIAAAENINVAYSNEVFELWLLLHLADVKSTSPIPRKDIYQHLEEEIQNQHSADFTYVHGNSEIIDIILEIGNENKAIERASQLLDFHRTVAPIEANPSTRVHLLVKELRDWIAYYTYDGGL